MTRIAELLADHQTYSYEFFPPKDAAQAECLNDAVEALTATEPDFVSVTCGALGSGQSFTHDTVVGMQQRGLTAMPHVTCISQSREHITDTISTYTAAGINNILALHGDGAVSGDFDHAIDLVSHIRSTQPSLSIGVAAHPEVHPSSANRATDRQHLAAKLKLADFALTQFFFQANAYARLVDELDALDCRKPIIPGVILFNNAAGLQRIAGLNNTNLPAALTEQLDKTKQTDIGKLAVETAFKLIDDLRHQGIPGIHIYTLNRASAALELYSALH